MNKTRGLLSFVALLTIIGQVLIFNSHLSNGGRFLLHVADGILLLSALIMLLFSFFRVGVTACGELCYNPDNWYWKTMTGFYYLLYYPYCSSPFERGEISLCKAFWLTVSAIGIVIGVFMLAVSVIIILWGAYWKFGILKMILVAILVIVGIVACGIAFNGLCIVGDKIEKNYNRAVDDRPRLKMMAKTTGKFLSIFAVIIYAFLMLIVMPILLIMEKAKVSFYTAVIYYLVGALGLVLTIGGAVLLVWLVFKYLPNVIGNSVLGQFLSANIKQFCPTLTACRKS